MHFGVWHPISEASKAAPETAGVLQTRAEGALDYRTGRSAMIMYLCSGADETLRGYVAGRGAPQLARAVSAGARWIRFAEAPNPKDELERLLRVFVDRFGSPPVSNAPNGRRPAAAGPEGDG